MRLPFAFACTLLASCSTVGWEGEVRTWGSMREVMRDGQTQGRVRVVEAAASADVVGIGALAGLAGEISIIDGNVWITRAGPGGKLTTSHGAAADEEAALLVTASVSEWTELPIDHEIGLDEVPAFAGFGTRDWSVAPFVVKGRLVALDAHVLHGACPRAGSVPPDKEPVRRRATSVFGTLVGFWARNGAGTITHAGETLHTHVVVPGDAPWTGHVDAVRIGAGSTLRVPRDFERVEWQSSVRRPQ